jgi:hypothetical protein
MAAQVPPAAPPDPSPSPPPPAEAAAPREPAHQWAQFLVITNKCIILCLCRPVDRLAERLELLSAPRDPEYMSPGFIDKLPPEGKYPNNKFKFDFLKFSGFAVLLVVFNYLDDLSMCAASRVNRRWRRLLEARVTNDQWRLYTKNRWPLFNPLFDIDDWYLAFKKLYV